MWDLKKEIKDYSIITLGVFLVAGAIYFFLMPNNIAGGINGLAMVINHYIPIIPVGAFMIIMNIILFIVAFLVIGPGFGARTVYASFSLSGAIWLFEYIYPMTRPFTNDVLLELFFGIVVQGVGMAIIFNEEASTGGTDIIAKILNKYLHINIGKGVLMSDLSVTLLAGFTFGLQEGLYTLFSVILNGIVIDRMIEGLNSCKEIRIISNKSKEIEEFILKELGRGATTYYAKGSFSQKDIEVLCTVVDTKELIKIKNFIRTVDKNAFVNVTEVFETLGDGFKSMA